MPIFNNTTVKNVCNCQFLSTSFIQKNVSNWLLCFNNRFEQYKNCNINEVCSHFGALKDNSLIDEIEKITGLPLNVKDLPGVFLFLKLVYITTVFVLLEKVWEAEKALSFLLHDLPENEFICEIFTCKSKNILNLKTTLINEVKDKLEKRETDTSKVQDFFTEIYCQIFTRRMRHISGEYYTPAWLASEILSDLNYCRREPETFLDPCSGSGIFILEALKKLLQIAPNNAKADFFLSRMSGFDLNPLAVLTCRANLRLNLFYQRGLELPLSIENIRYADFLLCFSQRNLSGQVQTNNNTEVPDVQRSRYDVIAGNPPWIAWDNLPVEYRKKTDFLWRQYGLFHLSASAARHGGAKKDLSEVVFYCAGDQLTDSGRMGMVLPQNLLQNIAAGGFRAWKLPDQTPLKINQIKDYTHLNLFGTSAAKACVISVEKGLSTIYPVSYTIYKKQSNRVKDNDKLNDKDKPKNTDLSISPRLKSEPFQASLSDSRNPLSAWKITPIRSRDFMPSNPSDTVGLEAKFPTCGSDYQARLGANSGGANAVFWLKILEVLDSGLVRVENLPETSKKAVEKTECILESELLYPLARWKYIQRWNIVSDNTVILVVQDGLTRRGLPRSVLESRFPRTLEYLLKFESLLSNRAAQKRYQAGNEFYSMYNIGNYTFKPWKTIWRRMDKVIRAAAVGPKSVLGLSVKPVFPQETCVFIPAENQNEANYLAAILNSNPVNELVRSMSVVGGKGFGSPGILKFIPLRQFDTCNPIHVLLSEWSDRMAKSGDNLALQTQIDNLVRELWSENTEG